MHGTNFVQYLICFVCLALFGFTANCQRIDWSTISQDQLSKLPASAFATITAPQVASIPPRSLWGLGPDQFAAIPPSAIKGFSATQVQYFGQYTFSGISADQMSAFVPSACNAFRYNLIGAMALPGFAGLTAGCLSQFRKDDQSPCISFTPSAIAVMQPATFSGFQGFCITFLTSDVIQVISADQLSNLNPNACGFFARYQVVQFKVSEIHGLQAACIQNFTQSACQGFTTEEIANLNVNAMTGLTAPCIAATVIDAFTEVSANQMQAITPAAFSGFYNQLQFISDDALNAISVSQLLQISSTMGGLTADALAFLINKYQSYIVQQLTVSSTNAYPYTNLYAFKKQIPSAVNYMVKWNFLSTRFANATWLQLALLQQVPSSSLDSDFMTQLSPAAMMGLRPDQVKIIAPSVFAYINSMQAAYLVFDSASVITSDQLVQIRPAVFDAINTEGISGIDPSVIPSITGPQAAQMTIAQVNAMGCAQLKSINAVQIGNFQQEVYSAYMTAVNAC